MDPLPLADEECFKNARALQGKLQLAGWLDAKVEASFRPHRRGAMLELMVQCGPRWHVTGEVCDPRNGGRARNGIQFRIGPRFGEQHHACRRRTHTDTPNLKGFTPFILALSLSRQTPSERCRTKAGFDCEVCTVGIQS